MAKRDKNFWGGDNKSLLQVDFKSKKLIYPKQLIINDTTTCNFTKPENFVVFECVHRLLAKGYKPEHIELEPKWTLGRDAKGGKADIFLKDMENKPYLLIECKTAGDEFKKEWGRMQNDGGQLFSYFQQERHTKFLCLYTSDFKNDSVEYENYIINMQDNEKLLKENAKLGYKDAHSAVELFRVWRDSYGFEKQENGIFEDEILSYAIKRLKPVYKNLKPMTSSDIQKKRHEWATILRANAVGDRVLALNKLMNLFLCKITDELENKSDLKFNWRGKAIDSPFDLVDRLQKLYKIGMEQYLGANITYHSKDSIDEAFSEDFKDITIKEKIQNIFNELKYFSNGDFNFIEVYNKALFDENFQILLPIVQSLESIGFTKEADSNILGDYFESYIHDMPQQEGQYFTPVPLVNFIISSLPVLKDAKVLDFSCGAGHFLTQYAELNKAYQKAYFLGIDKDQRLAKIAKIASFMHKETMDIYSYDALQKCQEKDSPNHKKAISNSFFNVLISNPPYAVDGFLNTLNEDSKNDYELFSPNLNADTNDAIECFFIEKASKALKSSGLLALVLPNSLLSKGGLYQSTIELVLRDFYIISIVELGSATFFKTGTSPIIIFALRKSVDSPTKTSKTDIFKDFHKLLLENKFKLLCKTYDNFLPLFNAYCIFQGYDKEEFKALLSLTLQEDSKLFTHKIFKEYEDAYSAFVEKEKALYNKKYKNDDKKAQNPFTPSKSKLDFIKEYECEKFLYFCYCYDSNPIIIQAPKDLKEQKKFLGWEWSDAKGKQGIVYINAASITELKSTLYNPKDRFDENKLNVYILQEYLNKIDKTLLDADFTTPQDFSALKEQIPSILEPYAFKARLIDLLDFSRARLSKAILLNRQSQSENPFSTKYELVRLGEILKSLGKGKRPASFENSNGNIHFYKSSLEVYKCNEADFDIEALIIGDGGSANIHYVNGKFSSSDHTYIFTQLKNNISLRYVYFVIRNHLEILEVGFKGIALKNIAKKFIENEVKIPLPPLEIQSQIVSECEEVERQYSTIKMSIEEYKNLIKAILIKTSLCLDSTPQADFATILANLTALISQITPHKLHENAESINKINPHEVQTLKGVVGGGERLRGEGLDFAIRKNLRIKAPSPLAEKATSDFKMKAESRRIEKAESAESSPSSLRDSANAESWQSTQSHEVPQNQHSKIVESKESSLRDLTKSSQWRALRSNSPTLANPQNTLNDNPTQSQNDSSDSIESTNEADLTALKALLSSLPTPPKDGWERVKLGEVCEIIRGVTYDKTLQTTQETNNIILTADNITLKNTFEISKLIYLNENFNGDKNKILRKNDIFICFSSGSLKHIGKVAFIDKDTNYYAGGFMGILRSKLNAKFIFHSIANDDFKQKLENSATGSNINNLSNNISNLQIPLPPLKEQEKIISAIEYIENEMRDLAKILDILESQKSKILQKYL